MKKVIFSQVITDNGIAEFSGVYDRNGLPVKIILEDVGFTAKDHLRLRDTLMGIKGKFLVSYNDCPEIREIWDQPNIQIEEISRLNNLAQRYDSGCQYAELLISNYDTTRRVGAVNQLSFLSA